MQLESAFALSGEMRVLGEDWARAKAADILAELAKNPGAGSVATMGAGMGMGMAAAPVFSSIAQQMFGTVTQPPSQTASGVASKASKFALKQNEASGSTVGSSDDFEASIKKLQTMLKLGAITQEQYDIKIQEIMDRM